MRRAWRRLLERFHLLWFNEPCAATNMRTIQKISDECVTPLGFGRDISDPSIYQDLLREGVVDILRPDLQRTGIPTIRRIASLAETYYTAVAPNHEGGPVGTAIAIQLAASLPNFFIQHVPVPAAEQDRRMRSELAGADIEAVRDGFLALPKRPGSASRSMKRHLTSTRTEPHEATALSRNRTHGRDGYALPTPLIFADARCSRKPRLNAMAWPAWLPVSRSPA